MTAYFFTFDVVLYFSYLAAQRSEAQHYVTSESVRLSVCLSVALSYSLVTQGRINHCAGCTMGGGPRCRGLPINCQIFTTVF